MQSALHLTARVQNGHKLEINAPELPVEEEVDVFVVLPTTPRRNPTPQPLMDFLDSLPSGPRSAPTWEEIERNLQQDRDAWDH